MDGLLQNLIGPDLVGTAGGLEYGLLIFLITFCMGHVVAWTYMLTHTGLSYSQMFAASLLVMPVLIAMTMLLVAGNLLVALGLLSVFTMIRFRNVLKDTRDTAFVLWSVVEGVAAGTHHFGLAVSGGVCVALVFLYMWATGFGGRHRYDVVLSFEWAGGGNFGQALRPVFMRHASRAQLAGHHDLEGQRLDLSYRLLLRDPSRSRELVSELEKTQGVSKVSLFHRSDEAEI